MHKLIVDLSNGTETVEPLTGDELAAYEKALAEREAKVAAELAAAAEAAAAKQAILDRLGLTAEEAALLLS